jgi:hypothetical protein
MNINIRLKIDAPTGWQRRVLLYVATPLALVAATAAIAHATIDTTWIMNGQPVSAMKLAGNLNDLDARVSKPTITKMGKQFSIGATYCGVTATTPGDLSALGGANAYAGAKAACQLVAACGNSLSAHMCSSEELTRTMQLGLPSPSTSWYAAGVATGPATLLVSDCNGYTVNSAGISGPVWINNAGYTSCNNTYPVACCD